MKGSMLACFDFSQKRVEILSLKMPSELYPCFIMVGVHHNQAATLYGINKSVFQIDSSEEERNMNDFKNSELNSLTAQFF